MTGMTTRGLSILGQHTQALTISSLWQRAGLTLGIMYKSHISYAIHTRATALRRVSNMTQVEKICANVSADIRPQAITLANAVLAMQNKIEQQIPLYDEMPLAQQVTVGTGESMLRQNPAVQEFRATVRDYAAALNNLYNIIDNHKAPAKTASLDEMRSKLRAVK